MDRDIDSAQRLLERYIHYHTRWKAHMDSLAMEKRQGQWFNTVKVLLAPLRTGRDCVHWQAFLALPRTSANRSKRF